MRYILKLQGCKYVIENHGNKSKCHFRFTNKMADATLFCIEELAFYVRDILEMYKDNENATLKIIPIDY